MTPRIFTVEEVAVLLQITPDTVRRLARNGDLLGIKIGNHWRFSERDIERFLESARPAKGPGLCTLSPE